MDPDPDTVLDAVLALHADQRHPDWPEPGSVAYWSRLCQAICTLVGPGPLLAAADRRYNEAVEAHRGLTAPTVRFDSHGNQVIP